MQISDVVLFYSQYSKESGPCVDAVVRSKMPIKLIPLDTALARDAAMNGSIIQIRSVPSMIVSFVDGNVQLYIGRPKIIAWMQNTFQPKETSAPLPQADQTALTRAISDDEASDTSSSEETPPPRRRRKHSSKKPPPAKKTSSKKRTPKRNHSTAEFPVDLVMEPNARPSRPPPPPTSGLLIGNSTKAKKGASTLMMAAKQMAADRENTLGYKPE